MANIQRIERFPPDRRLGDMTFMQRVNMAIKSARNIISGVRPDTFMSPLQPLQPFAPTVEGRQWDYPIGYNINFIPRGYQTGLRPFAELRNLSYNCEVVRLCIETVKDQISGFDWQVVPMEDSNIDPEDSRIEEITAMLKKPDKTHNWDQWLRMMLEEILVTDALSIYRPKTRGGAPYAFEIIDGSTIFPLIDEDGRTPLPPDPAYQQVLKGSPKIDYSMDELLYMPRNVRVFTPYGNSPVEQIIMTARKSINRDQYQLSYFTSGSVPDAYAEMPEGMTPDQIKAFEERFNGMLTGNAMQRKQVPFLPSGSKIAQLKEAILVDQFDEWMARLCCFCFSLPPNAFVKQQNRATAGSEQERALQEGQAPRLQFIKIIMDNLIADYGYSGIEFSWKESKNQDQKGQADIHTEYLKSAVKTINEVRDDLGLDPVEGGDTPMALTATGYVPLDSYEQNMAQQKETAAAQAKAKAEAPNDNAPGNANKYHRLGKAVRHQPIPLAVPPSPGHKQI